MQIFSGNSDRDTVVTNQLAVPTETRFIRFIPETVEVYMAMRAGVLGCTRSGAGALCSLCTAKGVICVCAGLCEWNKQGAWTAIPDWRGGCGDYTDCRNASWLSTCDSVMQCNTGSQYGMGHLAGKLRNPLAVFHAFILTGPPGTTCSDNEDCHQLATVNFRCVASKCQFASDGASFVDIPSWRSYACSCDADCTSSTVAQAFALTVNCSVLTSVCRLVCVEVQVC